MANLRDRSVGYLTNLAGRLLVRELARRLDSVGLSLGHMPVFAALGDGSAMTQKELAIQAVVEQPTMAATLSRMERDGLVARLQNPEDARSALVSLTPAALAKAEELGRVVAEVNGIAVAGLSRAERAEYLRLLGKIIAALEAADGGADEK
jgi:MarR family transcriptional regulator, transcriptional regulator for hemolysin